MNRLETAQYIADEFIDIKGKVIKVRQTGNPLEFKLIFEDGTTHKVTGLFAVRLQKASDSRMRVMLEDRMNINEVKPGDTLTTRDSGSSYIVISITGNNITLSHDEMNGEIDVFLHDLPEMFMDVEA